uniref:Cytochrome c-type protein n=1 Tax=Candidatus Kentrum sp. LPFa TaxID=2126335 RepID=A0A450WM03_9GAMM|nr:MAG: cytochrome c-type protein NapC [Candidatus Kentron sp. LPFa]
MARRKIVRTICRTAIAGMAFLITLPAQAEALTAVIGGMALLGGFNAIFMGDATNTYCISCHEMRNEGIYEEYLKSSHYKNRNGVRATCSDCHVPKEWFPRLIRKIQASSELYHHLAGTIDTPKEFEARKPELARKVWQRMRETDSRQCRNCHDANAMDRVHRKRDNRNRRAEGFNPSKTCIDCHAGIVHSLPHGAEKEP